MKADEWVATIVGTVLAGLAILLLYYFVSFVWANIWWIVGVLIVLGGGALLFQKFYRPASGG
jgi:hypothetical protein